MVLRSCASGTAALLLLITGCAAPQKLASSTSQPPPSPSAPTSPTPSPSPVAPLAIASVAFHAGEIGFAYAPVTPTAKGGVPPYSWTVSSGSFPSGLVMSATGKVAGTPTATGNFLFTVQVADSIEGSATISTSIAVSKHITVAGACPTAQPCLVEAGCVTACGVIGHASGGVAPFTYKLVAGALPSGMGLSGLALTNAFPSPARDWIFTIRVTDVIGATAQTTAKFHVFPHIAFSAPATASCTAIRGAACSTSLKYTLGTPGLPQPKVNFTVSGPGPGPLPTKTPAVASGGTVAVTIPSPTCASAGQVFKWTLKLALVDGSVCSSGVYCSSAPATIDISLTC